MRTALIALTLLLSLPALAQDSQPASQPTSAPEATPPGSTIALNGEILRVRWSDGDSFRILEGEYADTGVRLSGYNALESYGPVHRWGEWTAQQLHDASSAATEFARMGSWNCETSGERDHYGRLLVNCDDLTHAMVAAGHGHLFLFGDPATERQLLYQTTAQEQLTGMWRHGVPELIVTSLHSAAEGGSETYNRVVSTATGQSERRLHEETYETCQEVCLGGSCLVYVPFSDRYGADRAECLR